MQLRNLGNREIPVSQVGLGTWPLSGNDGLDGYGAASVDVAAATICAAIEAGITVFDTADVYGDGLAEELLGQLLRASDVVVSKGGWIPRDRRFDPAPDALLRRAESSLRRLDRSRIDVYLLHNAPGPMLALAETFAGLNELRRRGLVRLGGVSVVSAAEAWAAVDRPEIEVVELPFSVADRGADDQGLLTALAARGKGVIVREALVNGLIARPPMDSFAEDDFRSRLPGEVVGYVETVRRQLTPFRRAGETWADFALRFVLDRPEVSCVVVGARRPEQIAALRKAGGLARGRAPAHPRSGEAHPS